MSPPSSQPPRKIMQLFFQLHNRGGEQVARDLGAGLRERGHQVETVGFFHRDDDSRGDELTRDSVVLSEGSLGLAEVVRTLGKFINHVRTTRPDAVILHTTAAALIATPVLLLLGVKQRIVIHHNPVGTYQDGIWVALEKVMGSIGFYTSVVFVSERGLDLVSGWPKAYRKRARTILNGISLPSIELRSPDVIRSDCGVEPNDLFVISIGSLENQKNHKSLIDAVSNLRQMRLIIAGEGSLRHDLQRQAELLNAPVTFLGKVPRSTVVELYKAADVMAFPSLHEGRPLTLLEAVKAGTPIISSDIPENRAVLRDAALYLDPLDSSAWAKALETLADDPSELRKLRDLVDNAEVTTVDNMVDGYMELLQ